MRVRFWGTRGSIPSPGPRTAKYGGNTSCVEVLADDGTLIVLDCGTGVRELGAHLLQAAPRPLRIHLFIGHTHWDHIQGFPFFTPVFLPDTELNIYAVAGFQHSLEDAMAGQMQYSYFPIKLYDLHSRINFTELEEGFFRVGSVLVETQYLNHPAPTMAYRISSGGAAVAYVTDHEPFWPPTGSGFDHPGDQRHVAFLQGADLVIHDAQYSKEEYPSKIGWGHSTIEYATDVALAAGARRLALFHHDPTHDDATLDTLEARAQARVAEHNATLEVFAAQEGLELDVQGDGRAPTVAAGSALRRRPVAGRRVLVVSSNETDIVAVEQALAEDDLVLLSAPDRATALAQARDMAPDLAIVRAQLPDGAGAALIRPLRARLGRRKLPVLLLTNDLNPEAILPSLDAGATDYLALPFSPPMLRARVRAWLARAPVASRPRREDASVRSAGQQMPATLGKAVGAPRDGDATSGAYASFLAAVPLFRPLSHEQLGILASHAAEQIFETGRVFIHQGEPTNYVMVVLSGRVRVFESTHDVPQMEMFLGELGPGEVVGELGVLSEQARSASVVAIERTRCLALPGDDFLRVLRSSPDLANGLLRVLAGRIYDANRLLARYAPDPLTGLANRRAFHDQYRRLAAGARSRNSQVLLILLDILDLKSINDRLGYPFGDDVLRAVADTLVQTTRSTDVVARYGGDEFVAVLENAGREDVMAVLRRLQRNLMDIAPKRGLPITVRCSIGVAFSHSPPETADELLREADLDMHSSGVELPEVVDEAPPEPGHERRRRHSDV